MWSDVALDPEVSDACHSAWYVFLRPCLLLLWNYLYQFDPMLSEDSCQILVLFLYDFPTVMKLCRAPFRFGHWTSEHECVDCSPACDKEINAVGCRVVGALCGECLMIKFNLYISKWMYQQVLEVSDDCSGKMYMWSVYLQKQISAIVYSLTSHYSVCIVIL